MHPDGTWSRERAGALAFEHTPNAMREVSAFIRPLREELADPDDINAMLLAPDQGWPFPLPPEEIRDHGNPWRATGDGPGPGDSGLSAPNHREAADRHGHLELRTTMPLVGRKCEVDRR